jgi:hypothetical protein
MFFIPKNFQPNNRKKQYGLIIYKTTPRGLWLIVISVLFFSIGRFVIFQLKLDFLQFLQMLPTIKYCSSNICSGIALLHIRAQNRNQSEFMICSYHTGRLSTYKIGANQFTAQTIHNIWPPAQKLQNLSLAGVLHVYFPQKCALAFR